ncbi:hypothetical protein KR093_008535 [Drosophila rubida]|uniref:Uncharacterized protein n=1 Tax=Drosophila rubida TaxID=30044 RepID=A0AAD4K6S5_9MUSC|nr:hypothetical protein KR093_008535 [Drosophila rubida]
MICWGEKNSCGIFIDQIATDRCDCLRDYCIRDYPPAQRITVKNHHLNDVIHNIFEKQEINRLELSNFLAIKSIPHDLEYDALNKQAMDRLAQRLTELHFDVEIADVATKDENQPSHYMIFANYFSTPTKNVMLIYGAMDVPAVHSSDPWKYPPFTLTEEGENLYGHGLTTSKGPMVCWIQAIDAWITRTNDLPVNVKLIVTSNSDETPGNLRELFQRRAKFFRAVDVVVSATNLWIVDNVPMLTTCHSGYVHFELEVRAKYRKANDPCPRQYCSCGVHREPMTDLCMLLNTLTDSNGNIRVKGLERHVLPVTQHDWDIFDLVDVGIQDCKLRTGATRLLHEESHPEFLKHRWCMPHLSIHTVDYNCSVSLRDFRAPVSTRARFSIKLVPEQSVRYAKHLIKDHLDTAYRRLQCKNRATLRVIDQLEPTRGTRDSSFNQAAYRAYKRTYNVSAAIPDSVSACMPIINELRRNCSENVQVVGLPFCSIRMQPHQVNESCTKQEYERNCELFATFLFEVACTPPYCKCTEIADFCYEKGRSTDKDFIHMMAPKVLNTHVLYEIDEMEIDRTGDFNKTIPDIKQILLGKRTSIQT